MNGATEKREAHHEVSELDQPRWSVVSFDACEGAGLTYRAAVELLDEKEAAGVYGLCIVADEVAYRMRPV